MKFYIDYGTGAGNEIIEGTIEDAKREADEGICYTQTDCKIYEGESNDGNLIVTRHWWGCEPTDEDEEDDIIKVGGGFYSEWQ